MQPLTVAAAPTAGKAILLSLLEGAPDVFSTPLWHDNVSAALCTHSPAPEAIPQELAWGIYGNNLHLTRFRNFLQHTEYSRLESVSLQKFYIFHLSNSEQKKVPCEFDFYAMDKKLASRIWHMENFTEQSIFSAIFSSLCEQFHTNTDSYKFACSMPFNDFCDYEKIIRTFPDGKIIYIDRDITDALGSAILRKTKLIDSDFSTELRNEALHGNQAFLFELASRSKHVDDLQKIYPNNIFKIDFRELILNTKITIKKICQWMNIEFTNDMLKATFCGQVIDDNATGIIHDDIRKLLTSAEYSNLCSYVDEFNNSKIPNNISFNFNIIAEKNMKKKLLNIWRRICGTSHLLNEIEQLKRSIHGGSSPADELAYKINCNLLQMAATPQKYHFQLYPSDNSLCLYRGENGLSFSPDEGNQSLPEIFIITLPKSGTYFWGKILQECGYQDIEISAAEHIIADYRSKTLQQKLDNTSEYNILIPFNLQVSLLKKGQYLHGHLPFKCISDLKDRNFFITTRDLRVSIISWLRFCQKRRIYSGTSWYTLGLTEEAVFTLIKSQSIQEIIKNAEDNAEWVSAFPERVLRYEALSDPASKEFAHVVDTLGQLTGLAPDVITAAISRAQGTKTMTYSGSPSSTAGIWSERIEKVFCELKLDLLNEKLGYSREWKK